MRGYYEGRYRDKHSLEATVELRQHVWKRNGIVVWANMNSYSSLLGSIQIQRGVGSSTNGDGAFGGSISMATAARRGEKPCGGD